jgi:hypothetical protein
MKITNNVSFNVLCALALCVISSYLGYFFRSIQNNCILEDPHCIGHTQSHIYDENLHQYYTVLNTFRWPISPETFIESRCVSGKTGKSADTILTDMFGEILMFSCTHEINIWEYGVDDEGSVDSYHIEHLHDSLWLSSTKDTICIPSSWRASLANEIKHTPTDSISLDRMNIQEGDIQRFDSLLNNLPYPYYSRKSLSATNLVEKMRKTSPSKWNVILMDGKYLEIQFIDTNGNNLTAVNKSDIDPNGYIWTISYYGFYFRYHGLAFQELIRNCVSPDSPLYHKLEKEMMLLNLNATCWGEDVEYM